MLTAAPAFLEKTSLLIGVLVEAVLTETAAVLTPAQQAWFTEHCEHRFRWFHANNPTWRKWLEDRNRRIDPRDQCKVWIRHWLAAYRKNPTAYQAQHAACPALRVPERLQGGTDNRLG